MTPQEAQMLQDLVSKVQATQLTEKDPDAEALLRNGLARDPDALYKLAQTVLIQNIALDQARAQMQRMQQPAQGATFLPPGVRAGQQPAYAPPPQYPTRPIYQPDPYDQPPPSSGGFLRSAAGTAVGVAGGILAFEGIESLLHHGMSGGFGGFGATPQETIVNNYYDEPRGEETRQGETGYDPNTNDPNAYIADSGEPAQGTYDATSDFGGSDDQQPGSFDDGGSDAQRFLDDSGGGDFGDSGGDFGSDSGN